MKMKINKIKFQRTSFFVIKNTILATSNLCFVQLGSKNESWLVDTGASISALKYEHAHEWRIPIHKDGLVINGVGGKIQAIGYVLLKLVVSDQMITHKFYVFESLPCKSNGILGQDFLSKYKSTLNFKNNTISLILENNNKISLPLFVYENKQSYSVPSRSETIHYIDTSMTNDCVVCATEIRNGVFIASSIGKPIGGKIPVRILNTTDEDINLDNLRPEIHDLTQYSFCSFDKCDNNDANRVKQLFSLLQLKHLNKEEQISLENLCAKFSDIFCLPGDKLTTTDIYQQKITLKPNVESVYVKPYRLPVFQKGEIKRQIDEMLKEGIIEPCSSEWSSPVLLVPKKMDSSGEKKWRLVIDYRKLNNVIQDDRFPLPNITEIIDSLSGSIYFSHLDLKNGYYQCDLTPESRKYTAFCSVQYQMTRMPMGLKTSPSSFSRMMTMAMTGLTYEKCLVYLDDLIVYGKNLQDHNKNLMDVFSRLRKVNLKLNPVKCDFLKKEILYLGHVVSCDGILPDPEKISVIKKYPVPKSTDEIKRFVAFANYYRKFIKNFAKLARPLNDMCRKHVNFEWNEECQKSFELLKLSMASSPVLQYPDFSDKNKFIVQTDASQYAIGAVLCNNDGRPVAYASRSLNKAERNYPTVEKELLAVVWAVKHFRPYLYGRKFTIKTDHKPLVYLFNMRDPSSRLIKFRLQLEEYDYTVEYIKGSDNAVADSLSRVNITSDELKQMNECVNVMTRAQYRMSSTSQNSRDISNSKDCQPDQLKIVEIINKPQDSVELRFTNREELNNFYKGYSNIKESTTFCYVPNTSVLLIKPVTQSQLTPDAFTRELSYFCNKISVTELYLIKSTKNNIFVEKLVRQIKDDKTWSGPRIYILNDIKRIEDKDTRKVILNDFHLLPTSGHAGMRRMVNNIKKYYFWPGLQNDVKTFVSKCEKCQKNKHTSHYIKEPMVITSTANTVFEKVFLDVVGPLDRDQNNFSYILTLQCELSKYVEAYPMISKSTEEVSRNFVNNFILRYGVPKEIATDRGTEFTSLLFKDVCKLLQIDQLQSTAYHHQSIGALENTHRSLGNYLRIQTDNHPESWSTWLQFWCFSYNTSVHCATKYTPFELVFGKKCVLPNNLTKEKIDPLYNADSYPLELKFRLQTVQKEARDNLETSKYERKGKYDEKVNSITYKNNDLIWIKNETGNKLQNIYNGPYVVIKDVSPNVEIIKNGKKDIVHKNRTKLYIPSV